MGVGQDLHLDVPPGLDVLLDEQSVVPEGVARLARGRRGRRGVLVGGADDAHPLAAAPGRRLDQHREGEGRRVGVHGVRRHHRDAGRHRDLAGVVLAAHPLHHLRGRAHQHDTLGRLDRSGELSPLGQEAVAGVDRIRPGRHRRRDHLLDVEVAVDLHGLVGRPHVRRFVVDGGEHRDGADAEPTAGRDDAQRDLAAVRDEDRVDHVPSPLARSRRASCAPRVLTSGRCRRTARAPARVTSRPGPSPARAGCRPGRSRRRPTAAPSRSRESPGPRTGRGWAP